MERLRKISVGVQEEVRTLGLKARLFKECFFAAMHEEDERGDIVHKANLVELVARKFKVDKSEILSSPAVRSLGGDPLLKELRDRWENE